MGLSSTILKVNTKRNRNHITMICSCGNPISGFENTILICGECNSKFIVCIAELN